MIRTPLKSNGCLGGGLVCKDTLSMRHTTLQWIHSTSLCLGRNDNVR